MEERGPANRADAEYRIDAFTGDEYQGWMEIIILQNVFEHGTWRAKLQEVSETAAAHPRSKLRGIHFKINAYKKRRNQWCV